MLKAVLQETARTSTAQTVSVMLTCPNFIAPDGEEAVAHAPWRGRLMYRSEPACMAHPKSQPPNLIPC